MNDADTRPRMRLRGFKVLRKGGLIGLADITLPNGLRISEVPVGTSHGKVWAALPNKPVIGADGRHVEQDGKRKYVPILSWSDRTTSDRFSDAVVALVRQQYPEALGTEPAVLPENTNREDA